MNGTVDVELTQPQADGIARATLAVARADGVLHARELALIEELGAVDPGAAEPEPAELARLLPTREAREACLFSMHLVALADGSYSGEERQVIERYAAAFGLEGEALGRSQSAAKAFLMEPLLGLANTTAVLEVSRKLPM